MPSEPQEGNCDENHTDHKHRMTKVVEKGAENQPLPPAMQKSLATFIRAASMAGSGDKPGLERFQR